MISVGERPLRIEEDLPLAHLLALTDGLGVFEHAAHDSPRREHGYCLDDVARALVVAVRDDGRSPDSAGLIDIYLRFAETAIVADGRAHNRRDERGAWTDEPALGDWWGRALYALGFTAAHATSASVRARALAAFERAAQQRSPHLRAMASAAIGAAEVLMAPFESTRARRLLVDGVGMIPVAIDASWSWPERRLRYGNATIAEALLAAGAALDEPSLTQRGLAALTFLLQVESRDGHLSVTGVDGRSAGDHDAQFDQQPIEVAAIADAAARAVSLGLGAQWVACVRSAWAWFLGDNDTGIAMVDPDTGAGFDGLERSGRNQNRGAESTLAALGTSQQFRAVTEAPRS